MGVLVCSLMKLGRGFSLDLHAFDSLIWSISELRHLVLEPTVQFTVLLYGEAC
jgi:hypothetical protein